ncbi:MAG: type II secretion system F family protein [Candidatus Bathyarchaeota archaeon]|nr:type II secretion system F family protein [Candidatus Bathyarchaeota archaeon]
MPLLKTLEGVSFRLFGGIAPKFLSGVFEFKEHLSKAGIKIYPETYISLMLLIATLTIPVTVVALVLIYFTRIIFLVFLVPMPIYVMIGFMVAPSSRASERSSALEREMPFAATYVTVMASGGIPPYMSFKRLTDVELLPATRKEARGLIRDVEIFGVDPLSALENAAKYNPLDIFRDFISGYASTVIIGGDVIHFLETKAQEIFKAGSMRVKAAAERMGMLLESFIIVMVLMSLCFYILFSVESIYSTGMDMGSSVILYTYVFTPLLSIVFLYLAHGMQPKSPITEMRPYKVYAISSAVGVALLLLFTGVFGMVATPLEGFVDLPIAVAITLIVSVVPPAMVHQKIAGRKASIERGISNFLRDLTETRKTGLSPEACISNLSERDYGAFTKELQKMSSDIGWGIPMRNVIMDFVKKTRSWMSQIVMFLLLEAVDVGGGTISMIESLARFNNMTQEIEKEKKMSVRPYMIMPYFAAILLVATTLMTLLFTTNTIAMGGETTASSADTGFLQLIFTVSVITHCYLIGLVCGKISEESLAAGFKHSALLVLIAIVASKVVPLLLAPETAT